MRSVDILGVRVDDVTLDEAVELAAGWIREGGPHPIVTPNAEIVMLARRDEPFRRLLGRAALAIPDGVGLLHAARLAGTPLRQQVAGTDLLYRFCEHAARAGWRVFLLGAAPGVADLAARRLMERYAGLEVVGAFPGTPDPGGDAAARAAIRVAGRVDLIVVAFGAPGQERWIERNQAELGIPVAIGVGGALDFASGRVRRAPGLVRRLGLDWLWRLVRQPWRWRRQLVLPRFAAVVLLSAARARLAARRGAQRGPLVR